MSEQEKLDLTEFFQTEEWEFFVRAVEREVDSSVRALVSKQRFHYQSDGEYIARQEDLRGFVRGLAWVVRVLPNRLTTGRAQEHYSTEDAVEAMYGEDRDAEVHGLEQYDDDSVPPKGGREVAHADTDDER